MAALQVNFYALRRDSRVVTASVAVVPRRRVRARPIAGTGRRPDARRIRAGMHRILLNSPWNEATFSCERVIFQMLEFDCSQYSTEKRPGLR
jgi:hypothetical protein